MILCDNEIASLPEALAKLPLLAKLDLARNKLTSVPEGGKLSETKYGETHDLERALDTARKVMARRSVEMPEAVEARIRQAFGERS